MKIVLILFLYLFPGNSAAQHFFITSCDKVMRVAHYRSESGQSANETTYSAIQWDVEEFEDSGFSHDNVTNNTRISVSKTTNFLVMGVVNFYGTTGNYRLTNRLAIGVNGTVPDDSDNYWDASYIRATSGSYSSGISFSTVIELNGGDYFEIFIKRISTTSGNGVITNGTNLTVIEL